MVLQREIKDRLSFHFFRFNWQQSCGQSVNRREAFAPGRFAVRDVGRLRSNFEYLRVHGYSDGSEPRAAWCSHLLEDILQLCYLERTQHLTSSNTEVPNSHRSTRDELIQQAINLLHNEAHQEICLKNLTRKLSLSPTQFTRRFRAVTGYTPSRYLTNLRLQKARSLLLDSEIPLQQIAEQCGYRDAFYFSRVFTKEMQMSPSHFRRAHRV